MFPVARHAREASAARMPSPKSSAAPTEKPASIQDDAHAMKLVDELKNLGYSAAEVEQAFNEGEEQSPAPDEGKMATKAAPLSIPGI